MINWLRIVPQTILPLNSFVFLKLNEEEGDLRMDKDNEITDWNKNCFIPICTE